MTDGLSSIYWNFEDTEVQKTVGELARLVKGEVFGDRDAVITGVADIRNAHDGEITFAANSKYEAIIDQSNASAVVVRRGFHCPRDSKAYIKVDNPDVGFAEIVNQFAPEPVRLEPGAHPTAVIDKTARLGKNVHIGAYAVIEQGARIGDNTVIYPHVYIGHFTEIGRDCLIYANVVVRERCRLGDRVILHPGAVIGCDGFGYATVEGERKKIPQIGYVELEDDVEVGANTTIDRARFDKTIIKKGTKIDNLVQIAHNVSIGENGLISALTGISGSCEIGRNVLIAGEVGTQGHIKIGDNVMIAGRTGVTKDVPSNVAISGFPHMLHEKYRRIHILQKKLPQLFERVKFLEETLERLHGVSKDNQESG
jgi:UDP-3-O-[3-hydroxymyristoyl] glucosamine N-acyltransferase